jgi:hypothetical protein
MPNEHTHAEAFDVQKGRRVSEISEAEDQTQHLQTFHERTATYETY